MQLITGDLIKLNDLFRRHADFDDPQIVEELVNMTTEFINILSYYRAENPNMPENRKVKKNLKIKLQEIAEKADQAGLDEIILPMGHPHDFMASFVRDEVLPGLDTAIPVHMRDKPYGEDLHDIGAIDPKIKCILDQWIRGFCWLKSRTKYKWDSEQATMGCA